MIRPGKSVDAFALTDILHETYERSRYFGEVGFDRAVARKLFAQSAMRHGHTNEGGTCLLVSENNDGVIEAFVLGILSRIYMVGEMLAASDVFLVCKPGCHPRAMSQLVDGYVAWAETNPRVYEVGLSWCDTIEGSERITDLFERRGFTLCAKTYRRTGTTIEQDRAA